MLTVACYLWSDPLWRHTDAFQYGPHHVRQLQKQVAKNLTVPHEFVCITDRPHMFDADKNVRAIPINREKHIPGTEFVKLMTFHPDGKNLIGERVLQLDLDTVIVGNIDPIVDRGEDVVVWRNPSRVPYDNPSVASRPFYNGSVILHRCGTWPAVWHFNTQMPNRTVRDTQVWMSFVLGPNAPYWDQSDGIYRLGREDTPGSGIVGDLPANARIVSFVGSEHKPWLPKVRQANRWLEQYWPEEIAA